MRIYLVVLVLFCLACQSDPASGPDTFPDGAVVVFENVNLVSMENDQPLMGYTVVVVDDKIYSISKDIQEAAEEAEIINGAGKYLVPGLAEMHAHIPTPEQGEALIEETLFLYLAGGVTCYSRNAGTPQTP